MRAKNLAREIKLYSQYSTSENWINWYSKILPFKAKRTIKILKTYKKTNSVLLDVGCSTGLTLGFIAKEFKHVLGCDIDKKAVEVAKKRFKKMNLKANFFVYDGKKIPLRNNSVDIITSIEVFEHVNSRLRMLSEMCRVLKSDGILHITTANKLWPIEPHFHLPFLSYLPKKLANFYVRITRKGKNYESINLPTYHQFLKAVSQYFEIEDITLEVIKNYQKYGLHQERGKKIIFIAWLARLFKKIKLNKFMLNLSLGWLFICRPKKNASKN